MPAKISAFADEIAADPHLQVQTLRANGISYVELRGAWDTNVLKLGEDQSRQLKRLFDGEGIRVSCIGSPIGKVRLDEDWQAHFGAFRRSVELAEFFGAGFVRVFSYYAPQGDRIERHRDEVVRRLLEQARYVEGRPVTLALENESHIYGDLPERCAELMEALAGTRTTMAFDPANFVNVEAVPVYERCWMPLRKYVGYFHMKDAVRGQANAVPVGQGQGNCDRILKDVADNGYDGFLALEPHLASAGQFSGFTGPELFGVAARALQGICAKVGLAVE